MTALLLTFFSTYAIFAGGVVCGFFLGGFMATVHDNEWGE